MLLKYVFTLLRCWDDFIHFLVERTLRTECITMVFVYTWKNLHFETYVCCFYKANGSFDKIHHNILWFCFVCKHWFFFLISDSICWCCWSYWKLAQKPLNRITKKLFIQLIIVRASKNVPEFDVGWWWNVSLGSQTHTEKKKSIPIFT